MPTTTIFAQGMAAFTKEQVRVIKQQALRASRQHDVAVLLDNNDCSNAAGLGNLEFAAGLGVAEYLQVNGSAFDALDRFLEQHPHRFVFTWLTYDLKNELERLVSSHPDHVGFASCHAFVPRHLLVIDQSGLCIHGEEWAQHLLLQPYGPEEPLPEHPAIGMKARVTREQYLADVSHIRRHIIRGDVYELNYCTEFYAEQVSINAEQVYARLMEKSPVPFGAFVKHNHRYLLCASPERFMMRKGQRVYSQPIKGTAPRGADEVADQAYKHQLYHSEKERAENLMIVDLVRNDLARTAQTGTVKVEELFGIYSFPQVHQMISTISACPQQPVNNVEVIRNAFPMGSMTGAPKIMAMELIEQYERTRRGLYSGAVGYVAPGGDFDLNVVIRSLQYNSQTGYLSYEAGSAITYDSVPEDEYAECLLKASAMMEVLQGR